MHIRSRRRRARLQANQLTFLTFFNVSDHRWCHACKTVHPALMEAAAKHPDVIWLRAMADSNRELCKRQNVGTFPHVHLYRHHNLLANFNLDISNPEKLDTSVQTVKTTPTGTFKVRRQCRFPCFYLIGGLFPTWTAIDVCGRPLKNSTCRDKREHSLLLQ